MQIDYSRGNKEPENMVTVISAESRKAREQACSSWVSLKYEFSS